MLSMVTESIAFIIYIIPQYRLHTVTFRLVGVPQLARPTHHLHNSFKQRKYAVFSYAKNDLNAVFIAHIDHIDHQEPTQTPGLDTQPRNLTQTPSPET
jgi:hypothetical protein